MLCKYNDPLSKIIKVEEKKLIKKGVNDTQLGFFPELFSKVKDQLNNIDKVVLQNGQVQITEKTPTEIKDIVKTPTAVKEWNEKIKISSIPQKMITTPIKPPEPQRSMFLPLAIAAGAFLMLCKRR